MGTLSARLPDILDAYEADLRLNAGPPLQGAVIVERFQALTALGLAGKPVLGIRYTGFPGEADLYVGNIKQVMHEFGVLLLYPVNAENEATSNREHLALIDAFLEYHHGLHARNLCAGGAKIGRITSGAAALETVIADLQDVWHVAAFTVSWQVKLQ